MDISVYISDLLYTHECVIVPGFGGLVGNYRAAEIHPILHTITPPSVAITFNRHLQHNDALLASYISEQTGCLLTEANELIRQWAEASKNLLRNGETLTLQNIGRIYSDLEGNLQFEQDNRINYLRSSYGLPSITAVPILRGKEVSFTEKFKTDLKTTSHPKRKPYRIAAVAAILVTMLTIAQLLWMGVEIDGLKLNQASVYHFLLRLKGIETPPLPQPLPVEANEEPAPVDTINEEAPLSIENHVAEEPAKTETHSTIVNTLEDTPSVTETSSSSGKKMYYIIIGAFAEDKNVEAATQRLQERFPDSLIYVEKGKRLTKVGYSVGTTYSIARQKLAEAQHENQAYWLLKK